jgi:hypothetical protein
MEPDHPAVRATGIALDDRHELSIKVDWGARVDDGWWGSHIELVVREQGHDEPLSVQQVAYGAAASVSVAFRSRPGCLLIAELAPARAADGAEGDGPGGAADEHSPAWSRTLHVLAPFPAQWRSHAHVGLTTLVSARAISCEELRALAVPVRVHAPIDRGFGLELELLSVLPNTDAGHFTKRAELDALIDAAERAAADGAAADGSGDGAADGDDAALRALVGRLRNWQVSLDPACLPFPPATAQRLVAQTAALGCAPAAALALLTARNQTIPTEFKSALPPCELSFAARAGERPCGGAEAALGLRLIRLLGVCAPSISDSGCECHTSLHVHCNVRNARARGRLLTAREILAVFVSWVRFDAVTMRFCRSWCWADRWAAPLHATGSEFTFNERPLERGAACGHLARGLANDVPAFFAHAAAVLPELDGLADEDARVGRLFGGGGLGKYCSLNLLPLASYGTLEFRRQHASTDEAFVVRWAHFCVAFVEAFADEALLAPYFACAGGAAAGLRRLQREQRLASVAELMATRLGDLVGDDLPDFFRSCGCGPHVTQAEHNA